MIKSFAAALCCALLVFAMTDADAQPKPVSVSTSDVIYARYDGLDLQARLYRPAGRSAALPVAIDVHGGAWSTGDRKSGALYDTAVSQSGVLVIAIDFRQGPDFKHPAASADVSGAVRWVRANAKALNADPARIGLIGSSSGGHLALLAALRPNAAAHKTTPLADLDGKVSTHANVDGSVSWVAALWPVSDPAARYRYAKRAGITGLINGTNAYFADEAAQWDASIPRLVTAGEASSLPPIFVVQPGDDSNIPQEMTFDLIRAYQARGGKIDYAFYPGMPHAFGHRPSPATNDMVAALTAFIARQNAPKSP
jgi:acetyl esterase